MSTVKSREALNATDNLDRRQIFSQTHWWVPSRGSFEIRIKKTEITASPWFRSFFGDTSCVLIGGMALMASAPRDESTDVVENATSPKTGELATKSAEAHGAQTKSQQQAEQSKQDSPIDLPATPARRKRNTKATKAQQAPQTPVPTDKSKIKVPGLSEEIIVPVPQPTNNPSAPAIITARADFVADPEPVPQGGGFLCTFTLSHPGLVGLNKLAVYLNDLQDSRSIGGWQARGWEDAATKVRTLIGFANHADAITAIKRAH